ncbi:MAG TPA: putative Fe-S cluster assembly protein SufT [Thermoanaerobaculia bacterium]|nr:putative Fe-S cluster assembly protein SufT [Thermoanaerobaculia bacterium]
MTRTPAILLQRDCSAVRVPSGETTVLPEGAAVYLVQSLGGSFTVQAPTVGGLFRIAAGDADALGLDAPALPAAPKAAAKGPASEEDVWRALRQCYDPEIPVNIVDLGLVYDLTLTPMRGGPAQVTVKMTLTAPGCGMGPAIAADARGRILALPGVASADVHLVWDPPWSADMATPEGRRVLGM